VHRQGIGRQRIVIVDTGSADDARAALRVIGAARDRRIGMRVQLRRQILGPD